MGDNAPIEWLLWRTLEFRDHFSSEIERVRFVMKDGQVVRNDLTSLSARGRHFS
jgi:hypothetical protein